MPEEKQTSLCKLRETFQQKFGRLGKQNWNQRITRNNYSRERISFMFLWKWFWKNCCRIVMKTWACKLLLKGMELALCTGVWTTAASGPKCLVWRSCAYSGIPSFFWTTLCSWEHDWVQRDSQLGIWILQLLIVRFLLKEEENSLAFPFLSLHYHSIMFSQNQEVDSSSSSCRNGVGLFNLVTLWMNI